MKSTLLLKSISELISKNEKFLSENPEIFRAIEDRFYEAIEGTLHKAEGDIEDFNDPEFEGGIESDLGIDEYADDDDYTTEDEIDPEDIDDDYDYGDEDEEVEPAAEAEPEGEAELSDEEARAMFDRIVGSGEGRRRGVKFNDEGATGGVAATGYGHWKPKKDYASHHADKIEEFLKEGFSNREAERLAGAHDAPEDAAKSKVKASEPSERMLSALKEFSTQKHAERIDKLNESADPARNPIRHIKGQSKKIMSEATEDYHTALSDFLERDDIKGLDEDDKEDAVEAWEEQWHVDNPEHHEGLISAADKISQTAKSTIDQRRQRRQDEEAALVTAHATADPESGVIGQHSMQAAGGLEGLTAQGKAQAAGGVTNEEGGVTVGVEQSPHVALAERNPEFVETVRTKLKTALDNPAHKEVKARMNTLTGIKNNKGEE